MQLRLRLAAKYGLEFYEILLDGQTIYTAWSEGRARLEYQRYKAALADDEGTGPDGI
jgi:hypothetical protein